jgi:hypothetical protein
MMCRSGLVSLLCCGCCGRDSGSGQAWDLSKGVMPVPVPVPIADGVGVVCVVVMGLEMVMAVAVPVVAVVVVATWTPCSAGT